MPTTAWFTATGLGDLFRALGDIALAVIGFSVLGLVIGQFLRSAVFAVIVGVAWIIAVENIITRIVPGTAQVAAGNGARHGGGRRHARSASYAHGLIIAAVYLVAATAATAITFTRRDVTA